MTKLVTEAEYNDVILQMEQNKVSPESVAGVGVEEPEDMSSLKKRKRSPKESTEESRAEVSAKRTALFESPVDLAKDGSIVCIPRIEDNTPTYNRWLELIDEREEAVDIPL